MGFCDPKLMTLVLRYANITTRNGVAYGRNLQLARHVDWCSDVGASEQDFCQTVADAAFFDSSLQLAWYRINAFDVTWAGTRRTTCAGLLMRGFLTFYSQLPPVLAPTIDQLSQKA